MITESKEQDNVETEDFEQEQPDNGWSGNQMDGHGKEMQSPTSREL